MPTQVLSDLAQSKQLVCVVFQNWKLEVEKGNSLQLLALFAHYETKLLPAYFPSEKPYGVSQTCLLLWFLPFSEPQELQRTPGASLLEDTGFKASLK